ncbi:hypothetical protein LCGC14_0859980 [marine sediment metagenome]|uniref:Uncharacterized protein n=1 Tax=marine sediment metagenome TaxID=412755 RepID=A0A0F9PCN1_9ZZZZ
MAKRRKPRIAIQPDSRDPLEDYSTWDIRIAKGIYYGFILGTVILVLGIWGIILLFLFEGGAIDLFLDLALGFQIAIIAGAITGHLFLLVLFYTLFRGGMIKLCKLLFKDRLIAKKYEDYDALRFLIGIALWGLYFTLIALLIALLPSVFFKSIAEAWNWSVENFTFGMWILWLGGVVFLIVAIIFLGIVIWNRGVYAVLRRVKSIEEEMEIDEKIKKDALKNADERTLRSVYEKETSKKAIYKGQETRGYVEWKNKQLS